MLCPYLMKTETFIETWQQDPDENGIVLEGLNVKKNVYEYSDCQKENCGAYYDGKCNYCKD